MPPHPENPVPDKKPALMRDKTHGSNRPSPLQQPSIGLGESRRKTSKLRVRGLTKSYSERVVLDAFDLDIVSGEIVGLLGPNGAGKSTCFYSIVGLIGPDSGEVTLNGHAIAHLPAHKRARLGLSYLPQESSIFKDLTCEENIRMIAEIRHKNNHAELTEALIKEFGLEHLRSAAGGTLSGGERRRVEIARTLANDPTFMFLDEPFAGVDPLSILGIHDTIQRLKRHHIGVVLTDHNALEMLRIIDRGYIIINGKCAAQGTPSELAANPVVRKAYLGTGFNLESSI